MTLRSDALICLRLAMKHNEVQEKLFQRYVTKESDEEEYLVCPYQHILDLMTQSIIDIMDELFGQDED